LLASASYDKKIRLWDASSQQLLHVMKRHGSAVRSLAFDPEGKLLASGGADRKLILWNPNTGELLRDITECSCLIRTLAFNPTAPELAVAGEEGGIEFFSLKTFRWSHGYIS